MASIQPRAQFLDPPYHRHFSDRTALKLRGEASTVREYDTGKRVDTKMLDLQIRQLERKYEDAIHRYVSLLLESNLGVGEMKLRTKNDVSETVFIS